MAGEIADTPKPNTPDGARAHARVIASQRDAVRAAASAAAERGYHVVSLPEPVVGEAREAAHEWLRRASAAISAHAEAVCVLSAGETTVRVSGGGRGGRNQEFALALCRPLSTLPRPVIVASVGTDGIDGPTDAAGAVVDNTTCQRAAALRLQPEEYLADNDSHAFFAVLGDLVHLGRTDTNVGDVQMLLAARHLQ
jgi:hydroxypyruvate reductase